MTTQPGRVSTTWSERAVREALGLPPGSGKATYTGISTDTRTISKGALFVALAGERFDAHDYLDAAAAAGATGMVVRRGTRVPATRSITCCACLGR